VCAQHGHVVNEVQVPCGNTGDETKPPPEAERGRATDRVKEVPDVKTVAAMVALKIREA
jgi:hypothetical protein